MVILSVTNFGDGIQRVSARSARPIRTDARQFLRVKVTMTP